MAPLTLPEPEIRLGATHDDVRDASEYMVAELLGGAMRLQRRPPVRVAYAKSVIFRPFTIG